MPFNLGPGELIILAVAALLLFGPQKLPEIGRSLGEALGSLKKAYNSASSLEEAKTSPASSSAAEDTVSRTSSNSSVDSLSTTDDQLSPHNSLQDKKTDI
ncbi:MAG: twin-arginine translocase TatA/TatE family subunit [Candidatus Bruticola sp.]